MDWLSENWFFVLVLIGFVAMHLIGHGGHAGHGGHGGGGEAYLGREHPGSAQNGRVAQPKPPEDRAATEDG